VKVAHCGFVSQILICRFLRSENVDYDPDRITIAKHGLKQATGTRLTDGPYGALWADFSKIVDERDAIIHSETATELAHPDQSTAIDFYNTTVSLLVAAYDLFGFHNAST